MVAQSQKPPTKKNPTKSPTKGIPKKPTTKELLTIAQQRAAGATQQEIADQLGCNNGTVSRRLAKPEVRALIERLQAEVIEQAVPQAVDNIRYSVEQYRSTEDAQLREHGYKASSRMLEMAGIWPSHTPSTLIQQIYNDNSTTITAELGQLQAFIRHQWGNQDDPQVIDVAPTSYNANTGDNAADENPNDNNEIDG